MTVTEQRLLGTAQLRKAGIPSPALDADVLIAHALGVSKETLYTHGEKRIPPVKLQRAHRFLNRRAKREPVAYILGEKEFYGLRFGVNRSVLIPRPETETIVEMARELCAHGRCRIVDVGTGSGALAVTLAKLLPRAHVLAIDISARALSIAKKNARRHGVSRRIAFIRGNLLLPLLRKPALTRGPETLIITANLPYLPTAVWKKTQPEIRRYEPRLALDGGPDGTRLIRELLRELARLMHPAGHKYPSGHLYPLGYKYPEGRLYPLGYKYPEGRLYPLGYKRPWVLLAEIDPHERREAVALAKRLFPKASITTVKDLAGKHRVLTVKNG